MEDNLSKAIGRVDDQTNSFVMFCAVRGIYLSDVLIDFASELKPAEEYGGFTFDEWYRLVRMMDEKIIGLQKFLEKDYESPGKTTREVYPNVHALMDKLMRCMSRAVANGKST